MNIVWRKTRGDAIAHRRRLALIAMVLLVSVAAAAGMWSARQVLVREIAASFAQAEVPDLAIWPDELGPADRARLAAQPEVAAVEARRSFVTRFQARDGTWLAARVRVQEDFSTQTLGKIHTHGAPWPVDPASVLIEQSGNLLLPDSATMLTLRRPDGETVSLPIGARVHDPAVAPSTQERMLYVYVRPEAARRMGQRSELDHWEIRLKVRGTYLSAATQRDRLAAALAESGRKVLRSEVLNARHPHAALMNAMLSVLSVLAALAALTGMTLCAQLTGNWAQGERRNIGIMKTLGADTLSVFLRSAVLIAPLAMFSVLTGYAAGLGIGSLLVDFENASLNIDIARSTVAVHDHVMALALLTGIPSLALAWPLLGAARITPRAAMYDVNVQGLPRLARWSSHLLRLRNRVALAYAFRNTWRRPGRLLLMLGSIAIGAALVLTTTSNFESLMGAVEQGARAQAHDIEVQLRDALPADTVTAIARRARGVAVAEAWMRARVTLADPLLPGAGTEDDERQGVILTGVPDATALFILPVTRGRAMDPAANEMLVTRRMAELYPQFRVGNTVALRFRGRETQVRVAGMVEELATGALYTNARTFEAVTGLRDLAHAVRIRATNLTGDAELDAIANALDTAFMNERIAPAQITTRQVLREALEEHFRVVGDVIRLVGFGAGILGGLLLCATLSINLIERRRETGVLRTLGASPWQVFRIFLAEGLSIAIAGVLLGALVAIPMTLAMIGAAEARLLFVTIAPKVSMTGVVMLLVSLVLLAVAIVAVLRAGLTQSVMQVLRTE